MSRSRKSNGQRVLVVAAHPDDEILGCGATMAKHTRDGDEVHTLILAEGMTSRVEANERPALTKSLRELQTAARKANATVGVRDVEFISFPDNRMDEVALLSVVKAIEDAVWRWKPQIVYTHHRGDVNVDHQMAHEAVLSACRPQPGTSVKRLCFFEVPSSTEWRAGGSLPAFTPNWFVDVSQTARLKQKALQAYRQEMRPWPHPRSYRAIEALMAWRGATVGVEAAEAFVCGRNIE